MIYFINDLFKLKNEIGTKIDKPIRKYDLYYLNK